MKSIAVQGDGWWRYDAPCENIYIISDDALSMRAIKINIMQNKHQQQWKPNNTKWACH